MTILDAKLSVELVDSVCFTIGTLFTGLACCVSLASVSGADGFCDCSGLDICGLGLLAGAALASLAVFNVNSFLARCSSYSNSLNNVFN